MSSILERKEFCRDHFLASYLQFMLDEPNKDTFIDPYHIEFFERYARGNKPYYSAGIGKASFEATSTALVQIVPLIIFLLQQVARKEIYHFAFVATGLEAWCGSVKL